MSSPRPYPTVAYMVVGVIVAVFVALYAPRLADHVLGGGLLAGWAVAVNWLVGFMFLAIGVLAIVYARRRQPA